MPKDLLRNSVMLRMIVITVLGIVLLIPVGLVSQMVSERHYRRDTAVMEVTSKWGRPQTITGPILTIPVRKTFQTDKGGVGTCVTYHRFLPDNLRLTAGIVPEIRYRGIYRVVLYTATVNLRADFPRNIFHEPLTDDGEVLWSESFLTLGLTDLKGLRTLKPVKWGPRELNPEPSSRGENLLDSALSFPVALTPGEDDPSLTLEADINGAEEFRAVPVGKATQVTIEAAWSAPSFIGDFLPEKRKIDDGAFTATWNVMHLNRSLPQTWTGGKPDFQSASFGARLLMPVDEYQKNARAVKYAVLFIGLTFLGFGIIDVLTRTPFHPVHYTLVGLALILFFVLLLSISEHLSFNPAYCLAGGATILLVSLYTRSVSGRWSLGATVAAILTVLYVFLYFLLQLEDYALLVGSLGLFVSLALVMALTRKIDWFHLGRSQEPDRPNLAPPPLPAGPGGPFDGKPAGAAVESPE